MKISHGDGNGCQNIEQINVVEISKLKLNSFLFFI